METLLNHTEGIILLVAKQVPLELFVFVGSLAEEVFAPIPSLIVMTTAGLLAQVEGHTPFFLLWLVMLGNFGKILGSLGWYVVGDKLEDVVVGKFGKVFGLSHADIERIGKKFTGNDWRDGAFIFLLRSIPFFPSLAVSLACGVIKIQLRTFLIASYLGNFFKDLVYILLGYFGAQAFRMYLLEIERVRLGMGILIALMIGVTLILLYRERHRGRRFLMTCWEWCRDKLRK